MDVFFLMTSGSEIDRSLMWLKNMSRTLKKEKKEEKEKRKERETKGAKMQSNIFP